MTNFYDKDNAEAFLGATALALQDALGTTLLALAQVKGTDDLSWFDELHQQTVSATKRMVVEEVLVEIDAGARRFACEVLDAKFKSLRLSLTEKQK